MELFLGERCVDVSGYEGVYAVTSLGRLWAYGANGRKGRWLKFNRTETNYIQVGLKLKGQKRKHKYLHRLVASAFIANPEKKKQVNHKDGDRYNCKVSNLEWVTARENIQHAADMGLNAHLKLSYNQKLDICRHRSSGNSVKELAVMYGVGVNCIYKTCRNYMSEYVPQLDLAA